MTTTDRSNAVGARVRGVTIPTIQLIRSAAPLLLASAETLYGVHHEVISSLEAATDSRSPEEIRELADQMIRPEAAAAFRISERAASLLLERGRLLVEDLPRTRAALASGSIHWVAGIIICNAARTLPLASRAPLDERAAELAVSATMSGLRAGVDELRRSLLGQLAREATVHDADPPAPWEGDHDIEADPPCGV